MAELFQDVPTAISNSVEIAKRCNFRIKLDEYYLPHYPTPNGKSLDEYLSIRANEGLTKILQSRLRFPYSQEDYQDRLEYELGIINQMGFLVIF